MASDHMDLHVHIHFDVKTIPEDMKSITQKIWSSIQALQISNVDIIPAVLNDEPIKVCQPIVPSIENKNEIVASPSIEDEITVATTVEEKNEIAATPSVENKNEIAVKRPAHRPPSKNPSYCALYWRQFMEDKKANDPDWIEKRKIESAMNARRKYAKQKLAMEGKDPETSGASKRGRPRKYE